MPQSPVWALTTTEWLDHIWCDMPQRDTRTLHTHLRKVLLHLLKWRYQPWQRFEGHSWLDTILGRVDEFTICATFPPERLLRRKRDVCTFTAHG
jgi:hypothetical protein